MIRRKIYWLASAAASLLALVGAFLLRFDLALPNVFSARMRLALAVFIAVKLPVFYLMGRRHAVPEMASITELNGLFVQCTAASVVASVAVLLVDRTALPHSIYPLDGILFFLLVALAAFGQRIFREFRNRMAPSSHQKAILIYGAGYAGLAIARELRSNRKLGYRVVGFLDDDRAKRRSSAAGYPVLGCGREAAGLVLRFRKSNTPVAEIIIAMPSVSGSPMRAVIANCRATGVPFKILPGFGELLQNQGLTKQIREVSVDDLLGREAVKVSEEAIGGNVVGKSVLVTGGCGSIGSELCRQLARFKPRRLVVFDQAESEMFYLALELREKYPDLDLVTEIGDVARYRRILEAIRSNEVEAVFHAAAYKHVPLMEDHITEAAENNVIGTWNVVRASQESGVRNFLMISSDKAVNPTSIMGVTKRIGELIVSSMADRTGAYVSVRFGNVLASNGSVVNIFKRQIAAGGPVTVTHPEMRRYFMSIPEAVQLVLQAFSMGSGREIFVLDMGEPVRIVELARNMIQCAGLKPDEDIRIEHTGLRPGEKLFEELSMDSEDILPTYHEKVKIFRSSLLPPGQIGSWLKHLEWLIEEGDSQEIRGHLLELVPEYIGDRSPQIRELVVSGNA